VNTTTALDIFVRGWHEWRSIIRLLADAPRLRCLTLNAAAVPPLTQIADVVRGALARPSLKSLVLRAVRMGLRDGFTTSICGALSTASALEHCHLDLSLNDITLRGLTVLVEGLATAPALRYLTLDLSGNWIRGVGYGEMMGRLGDIPALRHLDLRFGGWGMKKQFGLEHLGRFGRLSHLLDLSVTVRGAQITGESFKKALVGIAAAPSLRTLTFDFAMHSTMGPHCQRAIAFVRACPTLRRLTLCLGAPHPKALGSLTRFTEPLARPFTLALVFRQPSMGFTDAHASAVLDLLHVPERETPANEEEAGFDAVPLCVHLTVNAARFDDTAWIRLHEASKTLGASRLVLDLHRQVLPITPSASGSCLPHPSILRG
jgi:hypothetical protein